MKYAAAVLIIFLSFFVEAQVLQKALEKYSKATSLQFDIKKTDEKIILGTKSESQGILKFQKKRIYILQNGDKKVEVFYMNKTLTLVEHPDEDFSTDSGPEAKRKITILKNTSSPLITSLLNLFSDPQNFNKEFSVESEKTVDGVFIVELKSKLKAIKNLNLKINTKDLGLAELSFVDDVETKTTLQFSSLKFNIKMNKGEFQYKPLESDEVIAQ